MNYTTNQIEQLLRDSLQDASCDVAFKVMQTNEPELMKRHCDDARLLLNLSRGTVICEVSEDSVRISIEAKTSK
jgi:hypothetical protein